MSNLEKTKPTLKALVSSEQIKSRFNDVLGSKSNAFITSILGLQNSNAQLSNCDPMSIIMSAMTAATLDLPINQNLGFAYILPYKKKVGNDYIDVAQFQMGAKGFVQLALRTGQYKTINVSEVYDGELIKENRMTGEIFFDNTQKKSEKIIGYVAYISLLNGFEKSLYMSVEQIEKHAKKYSQTYKKGFGIWKDDFDSMAKKTVIKMLISKWGMLSSEMQKAVEKDQSVINEDDSSEYVDNYIDISSSNPITLDENENK